MRPSLSKICLPYTDLRDDRPKSQLSRGRKVEIIERAGENSQKGCDLFGTVDALDFLQWHFPLDRASWQPNDAVFLDLSGNEICADAFWDFSAKKPKLYLRVPVFEGLFSEAPKCNWRQSSKDTVFHEFGHYELRSHRRKINARARKSGFETSRRAARSTAPVDWTDPMAAKARNLDLEEEANCYSFAAQVPVTQLDGTLTIRQIAQQFDVLPEVAYQAALLAKDYQRAKLLAEVK